MPKDFWRCKSGNFALLMGLALPAILATVGFATDVSTIMRAKVSLQSSLDAVFSRQVGRPGSSHP